MTTKTGMLLLGYLALFCLSVLAMLWWHRRQRRMRKPFGDDVKLLRSAGETQLRHVHQFDEDALGWMMLATLVPLLVGSGLLAVTLRLPEVLQWGGLAVTVVAFVGSFLAAARWMTKRTQEYHNRYLGYFGERVVAEHLEWLKLKGWRVFHDVPGENNGVKFNLDHVAVGPGGVFAIETKTRRKGGARPGFDDHKVYFDGRDLVWPWGEDNHGLEQAERNALWLANWIRTEIGERVHVAAILTLPGWWVENKPARESRVCRVFNPKALPAVLAMERAVLPAAQIETIAARLEARCRDVEY